jgi:hypothetical protein
VIEREDIYDISIRDLYIFLYDRKAPVHYLTYICKALTDGRLHSFKEITTVSKEVRADLDLYFYIPQEKPWLKGVS